MKGDEPESIHISQKMKSCCPNGCEQNPKNLQFLLVVTNRLSEVWTNNNWKQWNFWLGRSYSCSFFQRKETTREATNASKFRILFFIRSANHQRKKGIYRQNLIFMHFAMTCNNKSNWIIFGHRNSLAVEHNNLSYTQHTNTYISN